MTSVTTAAGLLSFSFAETGIVILLALLADLLLAPALITVATKNRQIPETENDPSSEPVFSVR
ncbi:MAG: hypothetical protein KKD44_16735 [Proteobacteria bacterium]|nr:hypothetical protein [Pseudomonadota bacterium]